MTERVPTDPEPNAASPGPTRDSREPELVTIRLRRSTLVAIAALIAGFVGGFWFSELVDRDVVVTGVEGLGSATPSPSAPTTADVSVEGRPARGPADAPVTIVEFTDYQCPFCKRHFDQVMPGLLETYGGKVRYVVRNLPITNIHPFARKAAEAAECAFDQSSAGFWEMHDLMFEKQSELEESDLKKHARTVGLDGRTFDRCLDRGEKAGVVDRDIRDAQAIGATGTPTFVINRMIYRGAADLETFKTRIDLALEGSDRAE